MGLKKWEYKPLPDVVDIWDKNRQPINRKERLLRKQGKKQDELYPYYGATGLVDYIDSYLIDGEFVLLGEDGAPFLDAFSPKAYIINGKSWVNNHAHVLKSRYNNKFLCYYLNCFNYKGYVSGTTRLKLTQSDMKRIFVPVPPIKEQEKIVEQIEESLSQLNSAVATLNKTKQQLEVYRQAVLKEAFDGNLTNSGKAKNDILKKYIEKPKYGTSKKCSYLADDTYKPVYRIPNINTKTARIVHTDIKYAHFDKKELETIRLQNNDLLIIRSNGSVSLVGRVALVTDDDTQGTFAGYLMRLRIINQQMLFPKYLLWYLQSKSAREYIESRAKSTSGVNNINSEEISNLTIPYYNLQSQKEIVEAIESRISIFDSIQQVVTTSLQRAEALRQSILKQAFEGK